MRIGLSLETTQVLRNTWHSAINHEWYEFLKDHEIHPLICLSKYDVRNYDLIILCGGNDMPHIKTWRNNNYPQRDNFEYDIINNCIKHNVPIIGICRGSHFINYVMGGTVSLMETPYDNVKVKLPEFEVTCHHTVYIEKLAENFECLQQDSQGVIELAVNRKDRQMLVGWHPERSVNTHTREYILNLIKEI
jgi:putative glutamine amidotransferase